MSFQFALKKANTVGRDPWSLRIDLHRRSCLSHIELSPRRSSLFSQNGNDSGVGSIIGRLTQGSKRKVWSNRLSREGDSAFTGRRDVQSCSLVGSISPQFACVDIDVQIQNTVHTKANVRAITFGARKTSSPLRRSGSPAPETQQQPPSKRTPTSSSMMWNSSCRRN
jgi:hypothetical protein